MKEVYVCLGGNLGNVAETFLLCRSQLSASDLVISSVSGIYESRAWGMENAPDFLNQVLRLKTSLGPHALLGILLAVEKRLGRTRTAESGYESRSIDIDILLYDGLILDEPELEIPHPRMHLRRFVLEPLCEIAPDLVHPVLHKTIKELLRECPDADEVKKNSNVV